jgi:hypothetical protein
MIWNLWLLNSYYLGLLFILYKNSYSSCEVKQNERDYYRIFSDEFSSVLLKMIWIFHSMRRTTSLAISTG